MHASHFHLCLSSFMHKLSLWDSCYFNVRKQIKSLLRSVFGSDPTANPTTSVSETTLNLRTHETSNNSTMIIYLFLVQVKQRNVCFDTTYVIYEYMNDNTKKICNKHKK